MYRKKVLYISGSLGLGHIARDLYIAKELCRQNPDVEVSWLAAHPATMIIKNAGENLLSETERYANDNIPAEKAAKDGYLNLLNYLFKAKKEWAHNVEIFKEVTSKQQFDLVIGDETYELLIGMKREPAIKKAPFVMIFDFIGLDAMTRNPLEVLGIYVWNRIWANIDKRVPVFDLALFVGEQEDIPDRKLGFLLPNRRNWAKARCEFLSYVLAFDPSEYADKKKLREKLGYRDDPLIICSIGGTSVGKHLLELCGQAYPMIKEKIPNLQMVMVCGPRLLTEMLEVPHGLEVKGFVPALFEHFAASDLAVVLGGGTTTLELTALRRPFLYFPLEGHCEQQLNVAYRLARHRAGVKMLFSETTPESLAERIISNIGKEVNYKSIHTDGAKKAAQLVNELLN